MYGPADSSRAPRAPRAAGTGPRRGAADASARAADRECATPSRAAPSREGAEERHIPGSGPIRFIQESIGELKKVEWPNQKAVISGTAVVIIACIIVGAYLWLNDELWKYVVQHVLLR